MKRLFFILLTLTVIVSSCVPKEKLLETEVRLDSLVQVNSMYKENLRSLNQFIDALAVSIDSIAFSEDILLLTENGYGKKNSRYQMMQNLSNFESLLSRQKDKINALDSILSTRADSTSAMRVLLNNYKNQLNDKEIYIAGLKYELTQKSKRISTLETKVTNMYGEIEKLTDESEQLGNILQVQTDYINKGYFWIASKKEMKKNGVVKGLSKVYLSNAPIGEFIEVDIRTFTEVLINSSIVKILSPVPTDSYYIQSHNDGKSTLKITDPTSFWSLCSYLVIQTK